MTEPCRPLRYVWPLQAAVALVFTLLTVVIAGGLVLYNHSQLTHFARREARSNFESVTRMIRTERLGNFRASEALFDTISLTFDPDQPADRLHATLLALFRQVERTSPATFGLFIAYPDGGRIEAQNLKGPRPPLLTGVGGDKAAFGLSIIEPGPGGMTDYWIVYDAEGRELARTPKIASDFDARTRVWHQLALENRGSILTRPYVFQNAPGIGVTFARAIHSRPGTVFGLDITLAGLDGVLAEGRQRAPSVEPVIFDRAGHLVAHPDGQALRNAAAPGMAARAAPIDAMPKLDAVGSPVLAAMGRSFAETGLDRDTTFQLGGETYFARFEAGGTGVGDFVIGLAVPESVMMSDANQIRMVLLSSAGLALTIALILIFLAARRLVAPLKLATRDLDDIVALRFGRVQRVDSRLAEVADLGRAIATLELVLQNFVRYVPFALVRGIVDRTFSPELGGRRQPIFVMFSDIEGFTGLAETLDPDDLTRQTSRYFGEIGREIERSGGTIDKYIGDAVMAFWNAPETQADYVRIGCIGVLRAARRIEQLNADFAAEGLPLMPTRFGIHTGEAVIGNVGTVDRMNYTALGHTVNLASRLEGLNRQFGTTILASEAVMQAAGPGFDFRPVGETIPRGATQPVKLYELVGEIGDEAEHRAPVAEPAPA